MNESLSHTVKQQLTEEVKTAKSRKQSKHQPIDPIVAIIGKLQKLFLTHSPKIHFQRYY